MCNKQETINKLTAASIALVEKYNSVVQDREWIALKAVAAVNGFAYRGPWLIKEIEDLARIANEAREIQKTCDKENAVDATDGL